MSDDITQRLRAAVPKMLDSGTPIAWPCKVRSELLLEAAAQIERLHKAHQAACEGGDLLRAEIHGHTRHIELLYDQVRRRADERDKAQLEVERLREALKDMLNGWRYIRETYGDLAGVGWDRAEQKARNELESKP